MKLTILGSGTAVPNGERNSAGFFVETSDARVMIDCGAGTVHALARFSLRWEEMTHLFISHFHIDHCGEMASLMFAFKWGMRSARSERLTIIGPVGLDLVIEGLKRAYGENLFSPKFPVEVRLIAPGESLRLGKDTHLRVAKTPHTEESLAARIENLDRSICYTGDTDESEELPTFFHRTDVLISECSFRERREGVRHLSIRDAAQMAARSEAARLIATHFYFDFDEAELKRELERDYSGEVMIGKDGMTVKL
ncbi:MAG: ribonuclease Z [Acidobacteriota bacterium]